MSLKSSQKHVLLCVMHCGIDKKECYPLLGNTQTSNENVHKQTGCVILCGPGLQQLQSVSS